MVGTYSELYDSDKGMRANDLARNVADSCSHHVTFIDPIS